MSGVKAMSVSLGFALLALFGVNENSNRSEKMQGHETLKAIAIVDLQYLLRVNLRFKNNSEALDREERRSVLDYEEKVRSNARSDEMELAYFSPASEGYEQLTARFRKRDAILKADFDAKRHDIVRRRAVALSAAHIEIEDAAEEYAKNHGVALILNEPYTRDPAGQLPPVESVVESEKRRIVWANHDLYISEAVAIIINMREKKADK